MGSAAFGDWVHTDLIRKFKALTPEEQALLIDEMCTALNAVIMELDRISSLRGDMRIQVSRSSEDEASLN